LRPVYLISKTPFPGVKHIPILSIRFLNPKIDFSRYDGLVFTSKQGIEALRAYPDEWKMKQCVCVSESTAEHARKCGALKVEAGDGYGEHLPAVLKRRGDSYRWLYLRPKKVASDWAETARREGIDVDEIIVYETECNPHFSESKPEEDAVLIFTSPSCIRCFLEKYSLSPQNSIVVIGSTTQEALPVGYECHVSAQTSIKSAVDMACEIARMDKK